MLENIYFTISINMRVIFLNLLGQKLSKYELGDVEKVLMNEAISCVKSGDKSNNNNSEDLDI